MTEKSNMPEKELVADASEQPLSWVTPPGTQLSGKYHGADDDARGVVRAHSTVTIQRQPHDLYALWSDIEKAPRWQERVQSVTITGQGISHWVMKMPLGTTIEWDSEVVENTPGEKLVWRSISGDVQQAGEVTFTPSVGGRGTVVRLVQEFRFPGIVNAAAGVLARSPRQMVTENLRHFKELAETGEIPTIERQPNGPRGLTGKAKEFTFGETNPTPVGTQDRA